MNKPNSARKAAPRRPAKPPAGSPLAVRIDQVQQALGQILQWRGPADGELSRWFRAHPELGARDRHEVAESVFHVLRHLRRLRQLGEGGQGAASRRLALLGLQATVGTERLAPALSEAEADWLRRTTLIDPASLPPAVRHSLPDWLHEALQQAWGDEAESLMESLNQLAPLDLRVNVLKAERDALLAELAGIEWPVSATPWSPWGIRIQGKPALQHWPRFQDGSVEVQDEGSQLLGLLVAPRRGEFVIDFCAGAGGKTLLLGAMMRSTGRLYAFDVSEARLQRLKPRLARSGLSNVHPMLIEHERDTRIKRLAGKADRVLVDAPCSGTGTLRRNPDLKWRQDPAALAELTKTQDSILASAARCVAPGGRLVYATCSLLPVENQERVEAFLASHPDFTVVPVQTVLGERVPGLSMPGPWLQLRPDQHGTDGFFAAVLERRAAEPAAEA